MNFKSKIFIISLLLFILLAISGVSAGSEDMGNETLELDDSGADVDLQSDDAQEKLTDENRGTYDDLINDLSVGDYRFTLNKDYYYNGSGSLSIPIYDRDILIDGQGHTIDASQKTRIFDVENSNLTLENLTLKNARGLSNFLGATIYAADSHVIIKNCRFIDNVASYGGSIYIESKSTVDVRDSEFIGVNYGKTGGAIYNKGTLSITNVVFENLRATGDGAAIYSSGDLYINGGCTFNDNFAGGDGGAIYAKTLNSHKIENCIFDGNGADNGGAIYISDDNDFEIINSNFSDNYASEFKGGAIYSRGDANIYAVNSTFNSNKADSIDPPLSYAINDYQGGAIWAKKDLKLSNCSFTNNYAFDSGGAIYADSVTWGDLPSIFTGNHLYHTVSTIKRKGGAIYVSKFTNTGKNLIFVDNLGCYGGAIYINNKNDVTFESCLFVNNKGYTYNLKSDSEGQGGAIYLDSSSSKLSLINNIFIDNTAVEGQAVYNCGEYSTVKNNYWGTNNPNFDSDLLLEWHRFKSNENHKDESPLKMEFLIDADKISRNQDYQLTLRFLDSDDNLFTGNLTVDSVSFASNKNAKFTSIEINDNTITAVFTPLEYASYEITARIKGHSIISLNISSMTDFNYLQKLIDESSQNDVIDLKADCNYITGVDTITKGIVIRKNLTINGNGHTIDAAGQTRIFDIFADGVTLNNITLKNGKSSLGGAVYSYKSDISILNSIFENNYASEDGGAIYFASGSGNTISSSTFQQNTAKYSGGAVYLGSETTSIIDSKFTDNNANESNGGAVYSKGANNKISNSVFSDNSASNAGGAICWFGASGSVESSNFTYNSAKLAGAIFWRGYKGQLSGSNFRFNTAQTYGSAVVWNNLGGKITDSTFLYNKAAAFNLTTETNNTHLIVRLTGGDNYVNAIYSELPIDFDNITYWNGYTVNSNEYKIVKSSYESGQDFYIKLIDNSSTYMIKEVITITSGANGEALYEFTNLPAGTYVYRVFFAGSSYYPGFLENIGEFSFTRKESKQPVNISVKDEYDYGSVRINFTALDWEVFRVLIQNEGLTKVFIDQQIKSEYIDVDLPASEDKYIVTVHNLGNDDYSTTSANATFTVVKVGSSIQINEFGNVTYGNDVNVSWGGVNLTGDYYVVVKKDGITVYETDATENSVLLSNLAAGTYTVEVTNSENENYTSSNASAEFTINLADNNAYVSANNVTYGENVTFTVNADVDGEYVLNINGSTYNISVVNGTGNYSRLFDAGSYYANITFLNSNYTTQTTNTEFTVSKASSFVILQGIDNVAYPNNATIIFNDICPLLFNVSIIDNNGVVVFAQITNDLSVNVSELPVGSYNVTVTNLGNNNVEGSEDSILFNVTMDNYVVVIVGNGTYGKVSMVYVIADVDGNYTVDINGTTLEIEVTDYFGFANITLGAGQYYANVTFDDSDYTNIITNTTFEIAKAESTVNINSIKDVIEGNNLTVEFTDKFPTQYNVTVRNSAGDIVFTDITDDLSVLVPDLSVGDYNVTVINLGNANITGSEDSLSFKVTGDNYVFIYVENATYGEESIIYIRADVDGTYTVDINGTKVIVEVNDGYGINRTALKAGNYYANVSCSITKYNNIFENTEFSVSKAASEVYIDYIDDIEEGENVTVTVDGLNITQLSIIVYDDEDNVVCYENITGNSITLSDLSSGQYFVIVFNDGNENISESFDYAIFDVISDDELETNYVDVIAENVTEGENVTVYVIADVDGNYTVDINGTLYVVEVENMVGAINMALAAGNYYANATFANQSYVNIITNTTFSVLSNQTPVTYSLVQNKNIKMYYFDGSKYSVKVIDSNGKAVAGQIVVIKLNKKTYKVKTDKNGIASLKIPKTIKPKATKAKKYTITATFAGKTVKNTITVKQNLKSKKTVKVKKSAKKLVLKAKLKNKLKGKKITFKFKGKKYKAKTNKKGVAKVKVKKKVIKKLKKGKKYKVKITYLKNTIKTKVKVK